MALTTIWVVADVSAEGKPLPVTLELLTKARELAGSVEAVAWGTTTADIAATLGAYGAAKVHDVGDLGGALPGAPVGGAIAAAVAGGGVDAVLIPHTYDGRDIAARLSVKLDRPVLTNVTDLRLDGDKLVVGTAIFGGNLLVDTVFTGEGPGHRRASSPSRSPPRRAAAAPAKSSPWPAASWARPTPPRWSTATSRSARGPSSTRPTSS